MNSKYTTLALNRNWSAFAETVATLQPLKPILSISSQNTF